MPASLITRGWSFHTPAGRTANRSTGPSSALRVEFVPRLGEREAACRVIGDIAEKKRRLPGNAGVSARSSRRPRRRWWRRHESRVNSTQNARLRRAQISDDPRWLLPDQTSQPSRRSRNQEPFPCRPAAADHGLPRVASRSRGSLRGVAGQPARTRAKPGAALRGS